MDHIQFESSSVSLKLSRTRLHARLQDTKQYLVETSALYSMNTFLVFEVCQMIQIVVQEEIGSQRVSITSQIRSAKKCKLN